MRVMLKELSVPESSDIYEMCREIGPGENGFVNGLYVETRDDFLEKLTRYANMARSIDLEPHLVPQTLYWLYVDDKPVGYGKLRHALNDKLLERGGHIGYVIRPSCRNQGYGKLMLSELLKKATEKKLENVLLTCDEENMPSRKVIEANNGKLAYTGEGICKYWISSKNEPH